MKIFVSSTSEDLLPYRRAAQDVVLEFGWHPEMMEYFGTEGRRSVLDECTRRVEACDLVLAILGWRLGSVPGSEKGGDGVRSYTAWEIEAAFRAGKPVLVLMASLKSWPQELQEQSQEARKRVEELRNGIDRPAVFFDWEPAEAGAESPLPVFRSKVRQTLSRHLDSLLAKDVRASWSALRAVWEGNEKRERAGIQTRDLENRPDLAVAEMDALWQNWVTEPPWHEEIRSLVDQIGALQAPGPRSTRMLRRLKDLEFDANYLVLCQEITALLEPAVEEEIQRAIRELEPRSNGASRPTVDPTLDNHRNFRYFFHQLEDKVATPRFRRCLLLCGSTGAGKSHRTVCFDPDPLQPVGVDAEEAPPIPIPAQGPAAPAPWRCLLLWLEPRQQTGAGSLEEEILRGLARMTGRSWPSLDEFDQSLKRAASQTSEDRRTPRLIVILDDLHHWIRTRPGFVAELERLLDGTTQLHSLYWAVTIQETAYDSITGEALEELWRRMSVTPDPRPKDMLRRRRRGAAAPDEEGLLGSWLNLDDLNRHKDLGPKLLAREIPGFSLEHIPAEERPRELTNPQIAWILFDCRDQLPPERAVDLRFIGFIESFWRKRWESLASLISGDRAQFEAKMTRVVSLVAHAMLEQAELSPEKDGLIQAAVERGRELTKKDLLDEVTEGLPLLQATGLLRIETVRGGPLGAEERLSLRALFFWHFHLAQQLFYDLDHLSGVELEASLTGLAPRFSRFSPEDREGTLEFLLLLADDHLKEDAKRLDWTVSLWQRVLEAPDLPQSALWLAAAKGSPWAQRLTAGFARNGLLRAQERRPLFTFLYFVSEVAALSPSQRVALLQPLFPAIQQGGLQSYCLYVLRRILGAVETTEEWLAVASYLPGSEVLEKTQEIGWMMVERAAKLVGQVTEDLLILLIRYLRTEDPEGRGDPVFSPWQRYFVREWILFAGFDLISAWNYQEDLGPPALFRGLQNRHWYESRKLKVGRRVAREMEQEANIAVGRLYREFRWPKPRREFEELIKKMAKSKDSQDRLLAFFLMRHTAPPANPGDAIVIPAVFRDLLPRISKDPRLAWLKEREPFRTELRANMPRLAGMDNPGAKKTVRTGRRSEA